MKWRVRNSYKRSHLPLEVAACVVRHLLAEQAQDIQPLLNAFLCMAATGTGRAAHLVNIFVKAEQGRVRVKVGKLWTRDPYMRGPGGALIPVA